MLDTHTADFAATQGVDGVAAIADRATQAARPFAATSPAARATALVAVADALASASAELVELAMAETGLAQARLTGELKRTCVQLKMFADVVVDGSYLDARIDDADPDFVLGPRPDLRRCLVPVGPVLVFAASNFPFAFSVAGGDTAAALAAGCPVIVKGHPGHPRLSARAAAIASDALTGAGMPDGALQLVLGQDAGIALLTDDRVRAAAFTGSLRAGRMLADAAAARPRPIPFFGELGSVNPVFVTRAALRVAGSEIAAGFVTSVSGSAGQLCTKPGFLFLPSGHGLADQIAAAAAQVPEHRLLNPMITTGYANRRDAVLGTAGVTVIAQGALRIDLDGNGWATPTIVSAPLAVLAEQRERLLDESFGPLSIIVDYDDEASLPAAAEALFDGSLTGTVHAAPDERSAPLSDLLDVLRETAGRVLFGGWPTGVSVTPAMHHGGPWPATTSDSTSVGTAAIGRFLRGVSFQNAPQDALPAALRDANPWAVPQRRSIAGESLRWGTNVR
jgi:NADP-dependent aldehyde dehydrogenase